MSRKDKTVSINTDKSVDLVDVQAEEVGVVEATTVTFDEFVDVPSTVATYLNRYLSPVVKQLLLETAEQHPDKIYKLCQYANISDQALIGAVAAKAL